MRHWHLLDWSDFVKGIAESARAVAMRRHLRSGCRSCRRAVQWLALVAEAAEAEVEPPEDAVRGAVAAYRPARSAPGAVEPPR